MRVLVILIVLALMAAVMWLPRRTPRDEDRRKRLIRILAWIAIVYVLVVQIVGPVVGILGP